MAEKTPRDRLDDIHCPDGCRTFEWGEWPGIGPVLLCIPHGLPAPGWAYDQKAGQDREAS